MNYREIGRRLPQDIGSPLHAAAKKFRITKTMLLQALRDYPEYINIPNKNRNTPLTLLILNCSLSTELLEVLFTSKELDICLTTKLKQNALCFLCSRQPIQYEMLKLFLDRDDKSLNMKDRNLMNASMYIFLKTRLDFDILKLMFIDHSGNIFDKLPDGTTLFDCMLSSYNKYVITLDMIKIFTYSVLECYGIYSEQKIPWDAWYVEMDNPKRPVYSKAVKMVKSQKKDIKMEVDVGTEGTTRETKIKVESGLPKIKVGGCEEKVEKEGEKEEKKEDTETEVDLEKKEELAEKVQFLNHYFLTIAGNPNFTYEMFIHFISININFTYNIFFNNIYANIAITNKILHLCNVLKLKLSESNKYTETHAEKLRNFCKVCSNSSLTVYMLTTYLQELGNGDSINVLFDGLSPLLLISMNIEKLTKMSLDRECFMSSDILIHNKETIHLKYEIIEYIIQLPEFDGKYANQLYKSFEILSRTNITSKLFGMYLEHACILDNLINSTEHTVMMNLKNNLLINYDRLINSQMHILLNIYTKDTLKLILRESFYEKHFGSEGVYDAGSEGSDGSEDSADSADSDGSTTA